MSEVTSYAIVLLPLLAAVVAGLGKPLLGDKGAIAVTCACVTLSALLSVATFWHVAHHDGATIHGTLYNWISTQNLNLSFGVMVDKLTATMLMVVTVVSACVHWYSIGYMSHDPSKARFFSYLSFFTFTMLALVSAPNLLQMFLGWEGVGLASYLLIGFWFKKESANAAAMKAFLVNRVADLGLLIAIFTTFVVVGSLDYVDIFAATGMLKDQTFTFFGTDFNVLSVMAFFLFVGAMGKSAQFGFHTWLPDAMEGPTPVSALIHAATMVTAGVFLVARMSPVFEYSGGVLTLVAWVGAITALFAATIGLVQRDIKRVIAYSTCSQLGYMFFACGVGAYPAAIFHLTTHAFFKALLFLGAGSVIHGMQDEQDMFKMGGLRPYMMTTYFLMWVGTWALMGLPLMSGFFSKDLILESAFMSGGLDGAYIYMIGVLAALMTAFYSMRVLHLTFHGKPRMGESVLKHVHDSPKVMILPMALLAVGAVLGGYGFLFGHMAHLEWWNGAIFIDESLHQGLLKAHDIPAFYKWLPMGFIAAGILLSVWFYIWRTDLPSKLAQGVDPLYSWLMNKWYVDELYDLVFVRTLKRVAGQLWQRGDVKGIDALGPNGAAWVVNRTGALMRKTQTGYMYHYAFVVVIGVLICISLLMF